MGLCQSCDNDSEEQKESPHQDEGHCDEADESPQMKRGVFGISLKDASAQGTEGVPQVVRMCCDWLDAHALQKVGIWREMGERGVIERIKAGLEDGNYDLDAQLEVERSEHHHIRKGLVVAGLLVQYIRDLPEGLINKQQVDDIIAAEKDVYKINAVIDKMAPEKKATLRYLVRHWRRVAQEHSCNKMTAENVAICIFMLLV